MLPVGICKAGPDPSIEIGAMAGDTDLGINLLPAFDTGKSGKKDEVCEKRKEEKITNHKRMVLNKAGWANF